MANSTLLERLGTLAHLLPTCGDYGVLISIIGDTDDNRKKYGRYTYIQWYGVLVEKNLLCRL